MYAPSTYANTVICMICETHAFRCEVRILHQTQLIDIKHYYKSADPSRPAWAWADSMLKRFIYSLWCDQNFQCFE